MFPIQGNENSTTGSTNDESMVNLKEIVIKLTGYENIMPVHAVADMSIQAQFIGQVIGTSPKTPVVANDFVETEDHEFVIKIDCKNPKDLDNIISQPVVVTVSEHAGSMLPEIYPPLAVVPLSSEPVICLTTESAADVVDALSEEATKFDRSKIPTKQEEHDAKKEKKKDQKKKSKSGSTDTKGKGSKKGMKGKGKDAKKSKDTLDETPAPPELPDTLVIGCCSVDLMPLVLGEASFSETYLLQRPGSQRSINKDLTNLRLIPRVVIKVYTSDNKPIVPKTNIFSLTIESIYNIPEVMAYPEMRHRIAVSLPLPDGNFEWVVFENSSYVKEKDFYNTKKWFGVPKDVNFDGSTTYRIDQNVELISDKLMTDEELLSLVANEEGVPRIQFNCLKRNALTLEAERNFLTHIYRFRTLPLEIYMSPMPPPPPPTEEELKATREAEKGEDKKGKKGGKDISSKSDKKSKKEKKDSKEETVEEEAEGETYLHLMALVDVSTLLYPGIQSCRRTCQLRTYNEKEIRTLGGIEQSFFRPKKDLPPPLPPEIKISKTGKNKKGKGDKKGNGKGSKKSEKKDKKSGSKSGKESSSKISKESEKPPVEDINLDMYLPAPPPPPLEPSKPLYSEKGVPTFIIVEVETHRPIVPEKELDDLSSVLDTLLPKKPKLPKEVIAARLGSEYYREIIRKLMEDMYHQHRQYLIEKQNCQCNDETQIGLLQYLQRTGTYQTYLTSITRAATVLVSDKFRYAGDPSVGSREYQNFISEIYVYMINEMNSVINEMILAAIDGTTPTSSLQFSSIDSLLLYAKEATELGAYVLADKYYLERIHKEEGNPCYWFDYAVFKLERDKQAEAIECLKEALAIDKFHKNSLLMFGVLLSNDGEFGMQAETCLLTVTLQYPRWVEGWFTLSLLYNITDNLEGVEVCRDMAHRYLSDPREIADYFSIQEDLAWFTHIVPKTPAFKTAILLIKMRLYEMAERAIALEVLNHSAICSYLLGVIAYYKKDFYHALQHLVSAKREHGFDYSVGGLIGHCLMHQRRAKDAKRQYNRILQAYNRPDDIHMIYIRTAAALEELGEAQEARNLMLHACKFSPTPYTWLGAGLLYLRQKDLISAEECLTRANLCDGHLPETWAYLALINVQLDRHNEADLCYRQAMKNNLLPGKLYAKLQKVFEHCQFKSM